MKMDNPQILVIGAAILDVLVHPADAEVFRTGSSPADEIRLSVGADALNEATILAGLGKKVRLETIIGADRAGNYILNHCRENGIILPDHCVREEIPTGVNVVLIDRQGARHFLTNPRSTLRRLTLGDIAMPFPESVQIVSFASIFVFPELGTAELSRIFRQAKAQQKIVCADMTKRKNGECTSDVAEALQYVDYLFPNDEEAMLLTGKNAVEDAARELKEAGVCHVVVKCGRRGCYALDDESEMWIPAEPDVKCVDTTGAGDSFAAGFLFALSEGRSFQECAAFGNRCGAKAVGVVGATDWV